MSSAVTLAPFDDSWDAIWRLSWPLLLSMGLNAVELLIDSWMAGWIGSQAQAAVAMAGQITFLYVSVTAVVTVGVTALAARAVGGQDWLLAKGVAGQALWLAAAISLCFGIPLYLAGPWLLGQLGLPPAVLAASGQYLHVGIVSVPAIALWGMSMALLRSLGDSATQLRAAILNLLAVALVEGAAVHAGWGIPGLALGLSIGDWLSLAYVWRCLRRSPLGEGVRRLPKLDLPTLRRIARIGLPAGIQGLLRNGGSIAFSSALTRAPDSTAALASLTIGMRVESLAYLPAFALGLAASTLVGQSLGAGRPAQARRQTARVIGAAVLLSLPLCLAFLVAGRVMATWFSQDGAVIANAGRYLWWMGVSEPLLVMAIVGTNALQGAGETRYPLYVTLCSLYLLRLPLAFYLVPRHGASGAWMAMAASMVLNGLLITARIWQGGWVRTRI